jgi:hypothetical protein
MRGLYLSKEQTNSETLNLESLEFIAHIASCLAFDYADYVVPFDKWLIIDIMKDPIGLYITLVTQADTKFTDSTLT